MCSPIANTTRQTGIPRQRWTSHTPPPHAPPLRPDSLLVLLLILLATIHTLPLSNLYHLNRNAAHRAEDCTGRLSGRRCQRHCNPPWAPMSTGECRSVTYKLPHDGDRGEWAGGTTETVGGGRGACVRRRLSDAGRLLRTAMDLIWNSRARALIAADEARWRASRLAPGSGGIRSQEARTRLHFWMSEF